MKVLHVISELSQAAGTSVFCMELCDRLQTQGVDCCILVKKKSVDDYVSKQSVPIIQGNNALSDLPLKPDIVHIHALWDPFLHKIIAWARRKSIPFVCSPHGMLTPWALNHKRMKKWLALALYQYRDLRAATLFHATAMSEVEDIRRLKLNQSVVVAPLGVNSPPTADTTHFKENATKTALFVSRVHPKKGLLNLVDAWSKVRPVGWKMVITGPDQDGHTEVVKARAHAMGVIQDFEFVGAVFGKDKDQLYANAALFVLPTYSENFGVVIIEALVHGVPVITTKGAPWDELVSECCGWWIDIGAIPLAEALREAMALTDEERRAMGENGRRLVGGKYAWPVIAQQMGMAYEGILGRDGRNLRH